MRFEACSYNNEAFQMFIIGVKDKHMKMAKNIDGFLDTLCPKYRAWEEL